MADQSIPQLPIANSLTGQELTVVVQNGVTKQTQVQNYLLPGNFTKVGTVTGIPTTTPTALNGFASTVFDTAGNSLYVYNNGLWRSVNGGAGTVTSVSGTGTVSGITLSGTVTSSGSLTLGGTLNLSIAPAIGSTTPNSGAFTTLSSNSNTTFSGVNANVNIQPTGTGVVNITSPTTGSMDGVTIGASTPKPATFTTVTATSGTVSATPVNPTDIANKAYVDSGGSPYAYVQNTPAVYPGGTGVTFGTSDTQPVVMSQNNAIVFNATTALNPGYIRETTLNLASNTPPQRAANIGGYVFITDLSIGNGFLYYSNDPLNAVNWSAISAQGIFGDIVTEIWGVDSFGSTLVILGYNPTAKALKVSICQPSVSLTFTSSAAVPIANYTINSQPATNGVLGLAVAYDGSKLVFIAQDSVDSTSALVEVNATLTGTPAIGSQIRTIGSNLAGVNTLAKTPRTPSYDTLANVLFVQPGVTGYDILYTDVGGTPHLIQADGLLGTPDQSQYFPASSSPLYPGQNWWVAQNGVFSYVTYNTGTSTYNFGQTSDLQTVFGIPNVIGIGLMTGGAPLPTAPVNGVAGPQVWMVYQTPNSNTKVGIGYVILSTGNEFRSRVNFRSSARFFGNFSIPLSYASASIGPGYRGQTILSGGAGVGPYWADQGSPLLATASAAVLPTSTTQTVIFDTIEANPTDLTYNSSLNAFQNNTTRTLWISMSYQVAFDATSNSGDRSAFIILNNDNGQNRYAVTSSRAAAILGTILQGSTTLQVNAGEYVRVGAYQNSGQDININNAMNGQSSGYTTRLQIQQFN